MGRNKTRLELWEGHLQDGLIATDKALRCLQDPWLGWHFGSKRLVKSRVNCSGLQLCGTVILQQMWGNAILGRRLALLGPVGQRALAHSVHLLERSRTASTYWNAPGKYGPHGELFFFLIKKEPIVLGEVIEFGPCICCHIPFSADTLKACALIGWSAPFGSRRRCWVQWKSISFGAV